MDTIARVRRAFYVPRGQHRQNDTRPAIFYFTASALRVPNDAPMSVSNIKGGSDVQDTLNTVKKFYNLVKEHEAELKASYEFYQQHKDKVAMALDKVQKPLVAMVKESRPLPLSLAPSSSIVPSVEISVIRSLALCRR